MSESEHAIMVNFCKSVLNVKYTTSGTQISIANAEEAKNIVMDHTFTCETDIGTMLTIHKNNQGFVFKCPENNNQASYLIYGKHYCPYCVKVIQLLVEKRKTFTYIPVGKVYYPPIRCLCDIKYSEGKTLTFPVVFFNGNYIGGYSDTHKLLE